MLRFVPVLLILFLTACAAPRAQCEREAAAPYRAALAERARIAEDLARGFTWETRYERVQRWGTCRAANGGLYPCFRRDMEPVTRRVPVDHTALEQRLNTLSNALPELKISAHREVETCRTLYPDDPA